MSDYKQKSDAEYQRWIDSKTRIINEMEDFKMSNKEKVEPKIIRRREVINDVNECLSEVKNEIDSTLSKLNDFVKLTDEELTQKGITTSIAKQMLNRLVRMSIEGRSLYYLIRNGNFDDDDEFKFLKY